MSVSLIDGHIDPDTNRMTDEQIIKAWEDAKKYEFVPNEFFVDETLDLIKRKQAEIERLEGLVTDSFTDKIMIPMMIETAKAEAVKEFAERLRYVSKWSQSDAFSDRLVTVRDINDIEEEMVGDADE